MNDQIPQSALAGVTDYHSHTARCGHASGTMEAYVQRAIELGLDEFGFSDHSHWMIQHPGEWSAMKAEELPGYVADVRRLQQIYTGSGGRPFAIRLGLEMDYVPTRLAVAAEVAAAYPWDYLTGSCHHLGLWGLPNPPDAFLHDRYRIEDVCELYFHMVGQMIDARFCDVLTHLDLPKKFGKRPEGGMLRYIEPLIPRLKKQEMAVEINTSGIDYECAEVFPDWEVVAALASAGVPLMLCSDAHAPSQVGRHFHEAIRRLHELGIRQLVRFERRRPFMADLPQPLEIPAGLETR
jgi:histidinol-phosphatase (PHP family)